MSRHAFDFSPLFQLFDIPLKPNDILEAGINSDKTVTFMKQSRNPLDDSTGNGWQVFNFDSKSMNLFELRLLKQFF
jgi:hypothetical protein